MQAKRYEEFYTKYYNSNDKIPIACAASLVVVWGGLFVCLGSFVPFPMKSFKFDLHSALMAIEQCGLFNVMHLQRHEASV